MMPDLRYWPRPVPSRRQTEQGLAFPALKAVEGHGTVWRVGYLPDPWAWSGWQWATNGVFSGRFDDNNGNFRTIYAGSSLLACLLEVLAPFRMDDHTAAGIAEITDDGYGDAFPTIDPGQVLFDWLHGRAAASAQLSGTYCAVTASGSLAVLYRPFVPLALTLGLRDFDAAALKDSRSRPLSQSIAAYLHDSTDFDGVTFASRHGDNLKLWAVFEQPADPPISPKLTGVSEHELQEDSPAILEAFTILGLTFGGPAR